MNDSLYLTNVVIFRSDQLLTKIGHRGPFIKTFFFETERLQQQHQRSRKMSKEVFDMYFCFIPTRFDSFSDLIILAF